MAQGKMNTADRVRQIAEPIASELGLSIWDIRYVKEGASWFLRVFIDKPDGVTIDDCEKFSRAVDAPLDEANPIQEGYYFEVSSPGLGRELTRPEHFVAMQGQEVSVKLIRPRDGVKDFVGMLTSFENDILIIQCGDDVITFKKGEISKVRLNDDNDI